MKQENERIDASGLEASFGQQFALQVDLAQQPLMQPIYQDGPILDVLEKLYAVFPESSILSPTPLLMQQEISRAVFKRGGRSNHLSLFPSRINRELIPCESVLELQAFMVLESVPEVTAYRCQPYKLRLFFGGKYRNVFPDIEVKLGSKTEIIDVRYKDRAHTPKYMERVRALIEYAETRGISYRLMTERDIRGERLENAARLLSLIRGEISDILIETVAIFLANEAASMTFKEAMAQLRRYPAAQSAMAWLALRGNLRLDLNRPINSQRLFMLGA